MRLGDVFKLSSGKSLPEKNRISGSYNVYGGNGITGNHNDYFVDESTVVIGRVGEYCGTVHLTTEKSWITDNALMVTEWYENVNKQYLVYMLNAMNLHQYAKTVGQPSISQANIYGLEVDLPSIEYQKEIVTVLNLISKVINDRKRELEQLDNLIKSRFVELFGDTVLNPFGWEKDSLGSVCDVRDGTHDSPKYYETGYPLVTSKNVTGGKIDLTDCSLICEADFNKINERSKVDNGDIIMPMIGTVGKPVIVDIEPDFAIKNVSLIKFKADSSVLNIYIRALLQSDYFDDAVLSKVRGGTQKFISLGDIRKLDVLVPPMELQNQFAEFVIQVDKLKFEVKKSLDETQKLMDSLMQQFFG